MRIKKKTLEKNAKRIIRHLRIRKKIFGTKEKPRLCIFKGSTTIYAQVIDDSENRTLFGIATNSKEVKDKIKGNNKHGAIELGKIVAQKCKEKGIVNVVFDSGGYKYHGVVKSFADSARESGLKF